MISNEMLFKVIEKQQRQIELMTKAMALSVNVIIGQEDSILRLYELNGIPTDPEIKRTMQEVKSLMAKFLEESQ
jgi:hypothetical protein